MICDQYSVTFELMLDVDGHARARLILAERGRRVFALITTAECNCFLDRVVIPGVFNSCRLASNIHQHCWELLICRRAVVIIQLNWRLLLDQGRLLTYRFVMFMILLSKMLRSFIFCQHSDLVSLTVYTRYFQMDLLILLYWGGCSNFILLLLLALRMDLPPAIWE